MTTIQIVNGEWEIAFADETVGTNAVAGLKLIRHISGTAVRPTNELYSAVADAMDELAAMGFQNPMLPTTPTAYTLENGYFMPNESTEFLDGGAISSVSWGSGVIRKKEYSVVTNFVSGDIGRQVTESGSSDTGTLLDFEQLPDGQWVAWIRPDDPATDVFDSTSGTISVTGDGGTGSNNVTVAATTGDTLWSNIEVIGGVATNSEVYIVQDRIKLTQFWTTDPGVSLGIIDVLIRVQETDTLIDNGELEVRSQRYTALYDFFTLDVSGGGRSSLPLATANDINNNTGYRSANYDGGTGSAMQVGDLLTNTTVSGAFYVVTRENDGGATGDFGYYPVGNLTDFSDNDTFTSSNRNGTIMGSPTFETDGPTDPGAGEGGTVTITLGTTTFDQDGDGTAEPYSVDIDAQGNVPAAKVYERIKYVCRRGGGAADLFGAGVNVDGERYRGMELQAQYDSPSGTFGEGEDVDVLATGYTARSMAVNTTDTYVTIMDQVSIDLADNDILRDEGLDTVTIMGTPVVVAPVKASPFGTFTGTQIFGARGILFSNPASGEAQNYILTDDNGVLRTPPNLQSVTVTGLEVGDVVFVADDTGTAGVIDKDRFGGMTVQGAQATTVTIAGSIDTDVPSAGFVRVVDDSAQTEDRYRYSSRTSTVFTLVQTSGTADAGGNATTLIDAAGNFVVNNVQPGDYAQNITDGTDPVLVVSVDSATQLTTETLTGGVSNDWATGDDYRIGQTISAYTTSDRVYAPIIDRAAVAGDGGTISNDLVQSVAFGVVFNGRQGKVILPFTQNGSVGATGLTLSIIRTPDTIAT